MMKMNNIKSRTIEKIIGLLFILATLSYGIGSSGLISNLKSGSSLYLMGLIESINSVAVILIGYLFYVLLGENYKKLSIGYLITRITEGLLLLAGTWMTIFLEADLKNRLLLHDQFFNIAMLVLGLYSLYYFYRLFKGKIGPRPLMLLGAVGYISLTVYSLLSLVGFNVSMMLFLPGGMFELVLPLYMIFRGLNRTRLAESL